MSHNFKGRTLTGSHIEKPVDTALRRPHTPLQPRGPVTGNAVARARLLQVVTVDECSPKANEAMASPAAKDRRKDTLSATSESTGIRAKRHNKRRQAASVSVSSRRRPQTRNLQSSLVCNIEHQLDLLLPDLAFPVVEQRDRLREPFSVGAILNSYRLLKAIEERSNSQASLPAAVLKNDLMIDVLTMLRREFAGSEPHSRRTKAFDGDREQRTQSSAKRGVRESSGDPSALDQDRENFSLAGYLFRSFFDGSKADRTTTGQSREREAEFPPGSPWEGCEELADEDLVDFLAESSQGWHNNDTGLSSTQDVLDKDQTEPGWGRWGAAPDAGARDTISASTDTGSISSRSMALSIRSEATWSRLSSARASAEPGSVPLGGSSTNLLPYAGEAPDASEGDHVWEREFAERVRRSMQ